MTSFRLGFIVASGTLPVQVLRSCQKKKIPITVIGLKNIASPTLEQEFPTSAEDQRKWHWVAMGQFQKILRIFKENKVNTVVFAGGLKRPSLRHMRMGVRDFLMFRRVINNTWHGDDSLLSSVLKEVQRQGFDVIGVQDIVDQLLVPQGALGQVQPLKKAWEDIKRGFTVAKTLGLVDVGQGVVVQKGVVLGVEAIEGTNGLIDRCAVLKTNQDRKPVLIKACKPQQDQRIDLPTIGPETIEKLHQAGFAGVAIEAHKTLILDIETIIQKADQYKIFVVGVTEQEIVG